MAGTTYDYTDSGAIDVMGEPTSGISAVRISIDFAKQNVAASGDNWYVYALKEGWILLYGFCKCTESSSAATVDIGVSEDGTELDTAVDISTALTDWTVMDTLAGTPVIITDDGYIWLDFNSASVSDGTLDILLYIAAAPGEDDIKS